MYDINSTIQKYKEIFACDKNFDLVYRTLTICERQAAIFFVDGFTKEAVLEKMLEFFYSVDNPEFMKDAHTFYQNCVPYNELEMTSDKDTIVKRVLSGMLALFVEGFSECILIDLRTYPQRDTSEPEKDKVFRGSKDGFVETLILNTALIRRRIRTPKLRFEHIEAGKSSKTDIALCYIEGKADSALVDDMRKRLKNLDIDALTMNQQSVADKILPQKWYNPFPKVKYSERPDTTSAQILEGDICILVDNSPSAMIMPANLFDLPSYNGFNTGYPGYGNHFSAPDYFFILRPCRPALPQNHNLSAVLDVAYLLGNNPRLPDDSVSICACCFALLKKLLCKRTGNNKQ